MVSLPTRARLPTVSCQLEIDTVLSARRCATWLCVGTCAQGCQHRLHRASLGCRGPGAPVHTHGVTHSASSNLRRLFLAFEQTGPAAGCLDLQGYGTTGSAVVLVARCDSLLRDTSMNRFVRQVTSLTGVTYQSGVAWHPPGLYDRERGPTDSST